MKHNTYLRFNGVLTDTLEFTFLPGWEVERIAHSHREFSNKEKEFMVETLTKDGTVIYQTHPRFKKGVECQSESIGVLEFPIVAYLPYNEHVKTIHFRKGDYTLYEKNIESSAPSVKIEKIELQKSKVNIKWKGEGKGKLSYNIAMAVDRSEIYTLAKSIKTTKGTYDLSHLPSGKQLNFILVATDGSRSSSAISKQFKGITKPKTSFILTPLDEEIYAADQAISFCGNRFDSTGNKLSEENLIWKLNGEEILTGKCTGTLTNLDPGDYALELSSKRNNDKSSRVVTKFSVAKRTVQQKRFAKLLQNIEQE